VTVLISTRAVDNWRGGPSSPATHRTRRKARRAAGMIHPVHPPLPLSMLRDEVYHLAYGSFYLLHCEIEFQTVLRDDGI
jgi:hypothetical protein